MHHISFTPRVFFLFVLAMLLVSLVLEVVNVIWYENEMLELVDVQLTTSEKRLSAIIQISENQKSSRIQIADNLSRYYSQSGMKEYVEIIRDGHPLFHTPDLDLGTSLRSIGKSAESHSLITTSISSIPVRIFSKTDGPYVYIVGQPLNEEADLLRDLHPSLHVYLSIFGYLLALAGLLTIYILHRPMRDAQAYVRELASRPKALPLPPVPASINRDVNELVKQIHTIVDDLHKSRNQTLEFSSMASHELRTPLSIIRNQLENALSSKVSGRQLRKTIGSIYDEMLRLNGTVEDLLKLSTLQAGAFKLNLDTFTLENFLKQFYDEALFLTRPKDISVVLKKGPHVVVQADHSRLRQVFFNLLDNSIKNTASGGRIRISYELSGNDVLITFADTGRGIPKENMGKIFEPFFKENAMKTDARGAGLGLALVKWIVEIHRGKVSVESQPGKGTVFFIRIPLYQPT